MKFEANWKYIKDRKQQIIKANNKRENSRRKAHTYEVGDKVLHETRTLSKYGKNPYSGPHTIEQVNNNGTVHLRMGIVTDTVNIRLLKPYRE